MRGLGEEAELRSDRLLGRHGRAAVPEDQRRVPASDHLLSIHASTAHDTVCAESKVPQPPRGHVKYAPMHLHASLLDRLAHGPVRHDDANAALNAQLGDARAPRVLVAEPLQLVDVLRHDGLERRQPRVEHAADAGAGQRCC